ncbi:MAG: tRNA (N6-isopentenyl adenosine(37)-C2)-methylthiotransferase MiaB [Candidatus Omnitrophica bacterium]|nr:tRNA (N6-isopentenyl adenosine(37)-C2)-methylthiotransferase MiaB [Candidatus Omnitrophota bacterium]MDD5352756.1 tRNA (N6-isopentenyl adenosine(37)-C2)-methylthiotransferase MiaB [Candidatus Omnitrophota bacterium]MDD5550355.1 tRNA (N6-isopentenyl adenosine(37)-C2)-methylthiotransferase MiaB [Candidatus Omnitrophota bacterium]
MKKVYIRTFGCQMNDHDSDLVIGQFLAHGYKLTENKKEADVVLLNTCSVRQHAEDRVFSELGALKKLKSVPPKFAPANLSRGDNHPAEKIIGVIGCMAKNLGKKIIERAPYVDLVIGPNDLSHIYDYVKQIREKRKKIVEIDSAARDKSFYKNLYHRDKKHAYVNISEGCSNFCSYCVVPYVRGLQRSRPAKDILDEIKKLTKDGVSSVTLLGQNVNDFGSKQENINFVELLNLISGIKGIKELSFLTLHPKDIDFRLFDLMAKKKNILKYLHLPIQSGSNRILKLMNRKYTKEKYLKIIKEFHKKIPNGVIATDVIVGFPTETEEDFQDTLDLMNKVKFNFAYIFKYSPRPHTKAQNLSDDIPKEEKQRRHQILLNLQRGISRTKKVRIKIF